MWWMRIGEGDLSTLEWKDGTTFQVYFNSFLL
jgi:hypothetical protein